MKGSGSNQRIKCPPPWFKKALRPPLRTIENVTLNENSASEQSRAAKTHNDSDSNEQFFEFAMLCYLLGYADGIHFKKESSWPDWFNSALRNPPLQSGLSYLQGQNEQKKVHFSYDAPAWLQYAMRNQRAHTSSAGTCCSGRAASVDGCSGDAGSAYFLSRAATSRSQCIRRRSTAKHVPEWFMRALKS